MNSADKRDRFIGALMGTFVGDALGMPYEGWGVGTGPIEMTSGVYTDDTQMMIGVAESLVACGGFDGADMARRFLENFDYMRGYGAGAFQVMDRLAAGRQWDQAGEGLFDSGSFGNGSAMRIAPIGVFYHDDDEKLREAAQLSSIISHTHPLGKQGAMLQAYSVALALRYGMTGKLDAGEMIQKLRDFLPENAHVFGDKLASVEYLLSGDPPRREVARKLGNGIRSFESVPTAIYSFLSHPESFEDAVIYAVGLGGDADTIGAMTGAIAGAYHGYQKIPSSWLDKLENGDKGRDYVLGLASNLYDTWLKVK
ncbi:ADP-ribosylglycohydrolase family protein [Candidatus Poribacteria bacterium]